MASKELRNRSSEKKSWLDDWREYTSKPLHRKKKKKPKKKKSIEKATVYPAAETKALAPTLIPCRGCGIFMSDDKEQGQWWHFNNYDIADSELFKGIHVYNGWYCGICAEQIRNLEERISIE